MTDQPVELLRRVEEGLIRLQKIATAQHMITGELKSHNIDEQCSWCFLDIFARELRSILEGDGGKDYYLNRAEQIKVAEEDEKILLEAINLAYRLGQELETISYAGFSALSRLSVKAKIGEAELREAKRGVLEHLQKFGEVYWADEFVGSSMASEIKFMITAIKEAGNG